MAKAVVLGVGNILLSDEGFGVRVAEALSQRFGLCRRPKYFMSLKPERFYDGALNANFVSYL